MLRLKVVGALSARQRTALTQDLVRLLWRVQRSSDENEKGARTPVSGAAGNYTESVARAPSGPTQ